MTLQQQLSAGLEALGHQAVSNTRTRKYRVYLAGDRGFYYVGRAGALRVGRNASSSIPVSSKFRNEVLRAGQPR